VVGIRSQVQHMLNYFHRRGKLVYFGGCATGNSSSPSCGVGGGINEDDDELLQRLAILDCSWFVQKIGRLLMASPLRSRCTAAEAVHALADPATDVWLRQRLADDSSQVPVAAAVPAGQLAAGCGNGAATSLTGRWLLAALDRLEMCVDLLDPVS